MQFQNFIIAVMKGFKLVQLNQEKKFRSVIKVCCLTIFLFVVEEESYT